MRCLSHLTGARVLAFDSRLRFRTEWTGEAGIDGKSPRSPPPSSRSYSWTWQLCPDNRCIVCAGAACDENSRSDTVVGADWNSGKRAPEPGVSRQKVQFFAAHLAANRDYRIAPCRRIESEANYRARNDLSRSDTESRLLSTERSGAKCMNHHSGSHNSTAYQMRARIVMK